MRTRKIVSTLAIVVALAGGTSAGCSGMNAHARSTMQFDHDVSTTLEDIARSVHCLRVSATYKADKEDAPLKERVVKGYGTAFAFATDAQYTYLITAGHVVERNETYNNFLLGSFHLDSRSLSLVDNLLDTNSADDVAVEVFSYYPGIDVAVIRAKKKLYVSHGYKTLDSKEVRIAEPAYIVGYPGGLASFVSVGTIGNAKGVPNNANKDFPCLLMVDTEIAPGNSGSPLFVRRGTAFYFVGLMRAKLAHISLGVGNACIESSLPRIGTKTFGLGGLEGARE